MKKLVIVVALVVVILLAVLSLLRKQAQQVYNSNQSTIPSSQPSSGSPEGSGNITLNVSYPSDGLVVNTSTITVSGTTAPQAEVSVNEVDTKADSNGKFSATINLDEGDNVVTIVANDALGNFIEKDLNLTFNTTP